MPSRQLIINADDLGFAPGVNRGIAEAHAAGTVTSASIMVTAPAFKEAAALVREQMPTLGVGLHFDILTCEPRNRLSSLTDPATGKFRSLAELTVRALAGQVTAADVRAECDAQLASLAAEGITPTHVDSHRHTHALPGILPGVVASARAAGIRTVRRPLDHMSVVDPVASAKMLALYASWRVALSGLDAGGITLIGHAPHFRGIALQGAPDVKDRLLSLLDRLPPGATELMLHPGYDDEVLAAQDPYRKERERELAVLTSPEVRERLGRGDVTLVNFGQLD